MWTCAGCDERIEEAFDTCWRCGTPRDARPDPGSHAGQAADDDRGEHADPLSQPEDAPPMLGALTTEQVLHQIVTVQKQQQEMLRDIQSKVGCLFAYMVVGIVMSVLVGLVMLSG